MSKLRVLVDTCVIIEAFRVNCWKALCKHFSVETVECCLIECCTGDPLRPGRVPIPRQDLVSGLAAMHVVDKEMLATLALEQPELPALDDGELHMMAWLHAHPKDAVLTVISTADRAAIRATHVMEVLERVTSLQELAKKAGVGPKQLNLLQHHFLEEWLSDIRLQLMMKII
jgi:hypothetical protein